MAGRWFFERVYWTVAKATGREPIAIHSPLHGESTTFLVPADGAGLDAAQLERRTRVQPFKTGEQTSGMNKICYYNCLGSTAAITIGAVQLCPLTIER